MVQAALLGLDYVVDAAVTISKLDTGEKYMVAAVNLQAGVTRTAGDIKRDLRSRIPAYMIPDVINLDVELYINKNGKLDKSKITEALNC